MNRSSFVLLLKTSTEDEWEQMDDSVKYCIKLLYTINNKYCIWDDQNHNVQEVVGDINRSWRVETAVEEETCKVGILYLLFFKTVLLSFLTCVLGTSTKLFE